MVLIAGCHGSGATSGTPDLAGGADMAGTGPVIEGEHGRLLDYFSGMPLAGATITEGTDSVVTGADGSFVLPAPAGTMLKTVASATDYATLYLPEATAAGIDVDRGDVPMAATNTFALEQSILANDTTKALVHVTIFKTGACTSIAGGTITVNAPAGAKVAYFSTQQLPTATSLADIPAPRPAAVLYDVAAGSDIDVTINVPGCTQVPVGVVANGMALTGKVTTMATEPGDNTAALAYILQ